MKLSALIAALAFTLIGAQAASAATPKDMFVMATLLDEFTSLDPGEIYELVPEEYVAAFSLYIFGIVFAPYWVSETHALFEASSLEVCLRQSLRY